jgi:[acyl-carrier-protein] S-malonyltransferase
MSRRDGVEIVRAAFSAIKQVTSSIRGGMTAIIGLKWDIIDDICKEITNVSIANINSATQVVVSGTTDGLEEIEKKIIEEGALDIKRLNIDAPLHSPLMKGVSDLIGEKISHIELSRPRLPIVNHTQPEILCDADTIKDVLCNQLTRKVLWRDAIIFMKEKGVDEYIEIGPLNVLSKIVRWIDLKKSWQAGIETADDYV